ncbi:MAG: Ribulose-5-phosphate 4-epimerase and related epimerases and aldolases, partial [uncultured Acetobacteraceae bacterium]
GYPAHERARGAAQFRPGQRGGAGGPDRSGRVFPDGGPARLARRHLQPRRRAFGLRISPAGGVDATCRV